MKVLCRKTGSGWRGCKRRTEDRKEAAIKRNEIQLIINTGEWSFFRRHDFAVVDRDGKLGWKRFRADLGSGQRVFCQSRHFYQNHLHDSS